MEGKYDTSRKLAEVLAEVMGQDDIGLKMLEHRAASLWGMVVGPTVSRATKHVSARNGTLFVELYSSVVRQELFMLKPRIIAKLNEVVGRPVITEIVFR